MASIIGPEPETSGVKTDANDEKNGKINSILNAKGDWLEGGGLGPTAANWLIAIVAGAGIWWVVDAFILSGLKFGESITANFWWRTILGLIITALILLTLAAASKKRGQYSKPIPLVLLFIFLLMIIRFYGTEHKENISKTETSITVTGNPGEIKTVYIPWTEYNFSGPHWPQENNNDTSFVLLHDFDQPIVFTCVNRYVDKAIPFGPVTMKVKFGKAGIVTFFKK